MSTGPQASDGGLGTGWKAPGPPYPAFCPPQGGFGDSPSKLFAGAGVAGGGPEHLGPGYLTEAGGILPEFLPQDPGMRSRWHRCACIWGRVSQLPVSRLHTCITYGSLCAVPSALTVQASPSASDGISVPSNVCVRSEASPAHVSFWFAGLPVHGVVFLFFTGKVMCGQNLC